MDAKVTLARIVYAVAASTSLAAPAQTVLPVRAAASAASVPSLPDEPRPDRSEPAIVHRTFEDGGTKIDELVVRGEVQHVVVTPKVGTTKSYEIVVQRGGRAPPDSTGGATSAVGKRVWNVLAF